jgi:CheY-like chemotaxis protein
MQTTHLKLMIVDDHAETRSLLRELIGDYVSEIRECANGEEAATQCAEFQPDLVTMDLNMPLTGGLEATRRILSYRPDTRIIVITQFDTAAHRRSANRAGACHFFSKTNLFGLLSYLKHQVRLASALPIAT